MAEKDVSGLPVIDSSGQLVGIIEEGDLRRRESGRDVVSRSNALSVTGQGRTAGEIPCTLNREKLGRE
jgi:CBS domain-containing protein